MANLTNLMGYAPVVNSFIPGVAENLIRQNIPYEGMMSKVFSPEMRSYFNVSSQFVWKKIKQVVFPFQKSDEADVVRKPELYIPIVSLMSFILFSSFSMGFKQMATQNQVFNPNISRRLIFCLVLTLVQICVTKFARFAVSSLTMSLMDLTAFISYRFVGLALFTIILTVCQTLSINYLAYVFLIYFILAETYFYFLELKNYLIEKMANQQNFSNGIMALVHLAVSSVLVLFIYVF